MAVKVKAFSSWVRAGMVTLVAGLGWAVSAEAPTPTGESSWAAPQELVLRPGQPLPPLSPGMTVTLEPGSYLGPWEVDVEGVSINGAGATLHSGGVGSTLILSAPGVRVSGLTVNGSGPVNDLYTPDAAFWLIGCNACVLDGVSSVNAASAVRVEESAAVQVRGAEFEGAPGSPAVTTFAAPGFALTDSAVRGFLDGVYVERSDAATVLGNVFVGADRYALHVMFSRDTLLQGNTVRGGNVGSAAMYGRGIVVKDNVFEGHVGPLAFGLLLQELEEALVVGNTFIGNTVALLVVSAPGVRVDGNIIGAGGYGMLVQRARTGPVSAVTVEGNRFFGNVSDIAVDDPEAAMRVHGNQFERASPLDMDADGISDVPHMPSSTYDMLASRQPDLSLFALSPGIVLWQTAEATVPALRLATLQDDAANLRAVGPWSDAPETAGAVTVTAVAPLGRWLAVGLVVLAVLAGTVAGRVRATLA